jgi:predicted aspartyl protease
MTKNYGLIADPRITVFIKTLFGFESITFLVDTGADVSMLPKSWAQRLGTRLKDLPSHTMLTASGKEMKVYRSQITIKLSNDSKEIIIPCTFTASDKTPLLLGRLGIFKIFTLEFSHRQEALYLKE